MKNLTLNSLLVTLKLYAIEAVAAAESKGRDVLVVEGEKLLKKEDEAIAFAMERYRVLTLDVPVLNATDVDDAWVEARVREFVRDAFDWMGEKLNAISRAPVVDDQDVPAPAVVSE